MPSKGTYEGLNMSKRLRLIAIALCCRERAAKRVYKFNRSNVGDVPRRTAIKEMRGWRAQSKCDPVVPYKSIASGWNSM